MAATAPFVWSGNQALSATDVARNRKVAEALANRIQKPTNMWEGIQSAVGDIGGGLLNWQADQAEEKGRDEFASSLKAAQESGNPDAYMTLLSNSEFATGPQSAVANALLQRSWGAQDRQAQWDHEDAKANRPDFQTFESGGDVYRFDNADPNAEPSMLHDGQPPAPKPPENYRWSADGQSLEPIPGGPADTKGGLSDDRKIVATDTILNAAATARSLVDKGANTGVVGALMGFNSESQAAELRRQVDVLKSNASIENLTAMRQASPTGGALGSVTEKENAMLAAAAGALNPDAGAEDFKRSLDNYELTLLTIIHGPETGRAIFEQTRGTAGAGANPSSQPVTIQSDEEYDALTPGSLFVGPDGITRRK